MLCYLLAVVAFCLTIIFAGLHKDLAWSTCAICGSIFTAAYLLLNKLDQVRCLLDKRL